MKERNECIKTITSSDAIVNIHIPILTEDKREKRTKAIQNAATELMKAEMKGKGR